MIKHRADYQSAATRALLACPLKALTDRGMGDLVLALAEIADQTTVATARLYVAEDELNRNRPIAAEENLVVASAIFREAKDQPAYVKAEGS